MYNAREATEANAPALYSVTHSLAMKMNMPMPKVYIIPSDAPNAFATGRNPNHAAVSTTRRNGCNHRAEIRTDYT
jgi:heat shock protein HtpX